MEESRKRRALQAKMFNILSELVRYIIFMYLILLMAYARRDKFVYYNNKFVANHNLTRVVTTRFVKTPPDVCIFLEQTITRGLYDADPDSDGFFDEGHAYFVQEPRLRQFRMLPASCMAPTVFRGSLKCVEKLGRGGRGAELDTADYGESWNRHDLSLNMTEWIYERGEFYTNYRGSFLHTLSVFRFFG